MVRVGSVVRHALFEGPGTVVALHEDPVQGVVVEVCWQAWGRNGFHGLSGLRLVTDEQARGAVERAGTPPGRDEEPSGGSGT